MSQPHDHEAGFKHRSTNLFLQHLQKIDECSSIAKNFEDFQSLLLEKYNISVIESRGRYRYLYLEQDKRITEKALGSHYGKQYLEQIFENSEQIKTVNVTHVNSVTANDYHREPILILYYKSQLRLVTDLLENVKAMQSPAYTQKVKISNLQQMANTIIYVEENGFDTQTDLKSTLSAVKEKLPDIEKQVETPSLKMNSINEQIHFTGQYLSSKRIYSEFLKSNNKQQFRQEHLEQIQTYEEARNRLKEFYPNGKYLQLKDLKKQKTIMQKQINEFKTELKYHRDYCRDLETADANVTAILDMKIPEKHKSHETEL